MNTTTIPTFKQRLSAFLWDYLIISIYLILLAATVSFVISGTLESELTSISSSIDTIAFMTTIVPVVLYFSFFESSAAGATWGKRKVGIKVVDLKACRLPFWRSLLRSIVKFLPWHIAHTCLFSIQGWPMNPQKPAAWVVAGFVMVWVVVIVFFISLAITPFRRTPYDRISKSIVILSD